MPLIRENRLNEVNKSPMNSHPSKSHLFIKKKISKPHKHIKEWRNTYKIRVQKQMKVTKTRIHIKETKS